MNSVKMYGRFLKVYFKQQMEFRFSFFGDIVVNMLTYITLFLSLWVLFLKFPDIKGWGYYETLFLYNLNLLSYAISSMFLWAPMKQLEEMIRKGEFDGFLVRPIPALKLLVLRQFQHTFIGHIIVSVYILILCYIKLNLHWSVSQIIYLIAALLGATLIHAGIIIIAASTAFWIVKSGVILNVAIYGVRNYINYPISIYGNGLKFFLTFIVPYAFVNFYPSEALLGLTTEGTNMALMYGTPCVGILLFAMSLKIFQMGIRKYESSGS